MEVLFIKLLEQLNGSVFTLIALLVVALWGMYKFGSMAKTFTDVKEKNKEFDTHIGNIKDTLATIKATTDLLYQSHIQTVQTKSPLSLSPLGVTFSHELHLEVKIAQHWEDIKREIEKKSPRNPYDIQVVSMDVVRNCFTTLFSQAEQEEIKLFAFKKGIDLLQIFPIVGVLIRDKYLKEQGIAIEEIDHHDPEKQKNHQQ